MLTVYLNTQPTTEFSNYPQCTMSPSLPTVWLLCVSLLLPATVYLVLGATNTSCPTGFYYNTTTNKCECDEFFVKQGFINVCDQQGRAYLNTRFCVSSAPDNNSYFVGECPTPMKKHYLENNRIYSLLPRDPALLTDVVCGPYNREGLLCGKCIDGYGLPIYSTNLTCAKYTSSVFKYLCVQFLPLTFFFLIVVISRINITASPLLGYCLFCQFYYQASVWWYRCIFDYIHDYASERIKTLDHVSRVLSEFWTLLLFKSLVPPFCISEALNSSHVLMLNLVPAVYILFLVVTFCVLVELHAKNYRCINFVLKPLSPILTKLNISGSNAIIRAFATFVFLSAITTVTTFAFLVVTTDAYSSVTHNFTKVLYLDTTVPYPVHEKSLIVIIFFAAVPCVFLVLIPALLLLVYPTRIYRSLSRLISTRKQLAITTFAEALHSCFKDGLNGTRDYRSVAGLIIVASPTFSLVGLVTWKLLSIFVAGYTKRHCITGHLLFVLSLVVSYVRPCKSTLANISLSYHCFMMGVFQLFGLCGWEDDTYETERLELTLVIIPLLSHILVLCWALYTFCRWLKIHCLPWIFCPRIANTISGKFSRLALFWKSQNGYQSVN